MAQQQRSRVIEKIASGGMAEVFRAESAGLEGFKKTVAIKRVLPHLSEKKQFIGMFLDEARLSAHLSHSNCVQAFATRMTKKISSPARRKVSLSIQTCPRPPI